MIPPIPWLGGLLQDQLSFTQRHGATLHKKGGHYHQGMQYVMEKKLAVAETYLHYKQLDGGRPSLSKIASEHNADWKIVRKIESEIYVNDGCVVSPEEVTLDMVSQQKLGPGSIVLDQAKLLCPLLLVPQEQEAYTQCLE